MDNGFVQILEKGGNWTSLLFGVLPVWALMVLVLVMWQRRRLGALVRDAVAAGREDPGPEPTVDRVAAGLGPLAGGGIGVVVVAAFWLVVLAALWAARSVGFDVLRLHEPGYIEGSVVGTSARDVATHVSRVLITRSTVGIVGLPAFFVSLLALDQMLCRPRTRLLDEVRRRWAVVAAGPASSELHTALAQRARARWSWTGFHFQWLWLVVKGRPALGLMLLGALVVAHVGLGALTALGLVPGPQTPGYEVGIPVSAWSHFWRPFFGVVIDSVPGLVMSVLVAMLGSGWAARRRGRDSGSRDAVE